MNKTDGSKPLRRFGRRWSLVVLGIAATEVLIMTSPFAGLFYESDRNFLLKDQARSSEVCSLSD